MNQPYLQGASYAGTCESGSLPQTRPSITSLQLMLITRVLRRGVPKGIPSQIGRQRAPCYGFTENVRIYPVTVWVLFTTNDF